MEVSVSDFRCFHQPGFVSLKPINILVGENSAGKTSFLAAVRYLFDLFDRGSRASFNKDPFHLGSYEHIAHYRGGRFGRAQSFGFSVRGTTSTPPPNRQRALFSDDGPTGPIPFNLDVSFIDRKSQPFLKTVKFEAGPYSFEINMGDDASFSISTPTVGSIEVERDLASIYSDNESSIFDLSFVELLLRSLNFRRGREITNDGNPLPPGINSGFERLAGLYSRALRVLPSNVYASAPVRSRPERTYNPTDFTATPDGRHMPFVLAQMSHFEPAKWEAVRKTLVEFGKASGLFADLTIKKVGTSAGGPFQIIVNMENRKSNMIDVGYGVSQTLPIVTDVLRASRGSMFLFQQPEVHLHPKAQAELGTFFSQIARQRRHTFLIETHSDHLIDRVRMHVRDGQDIRPQDVSILYFERDGHDVAIHSLSIDKMGNLVGAPPGYRAFFLSEELRSLGVRLS